MCSLKVTPTGSSNRYSLNLPDPERGAPDAGGAPDAPAHSVQEGAHHMQEGGAPDAPRGAPRTPKPKEPKAKVPPQPTAPKKPTGKEDTVAPPDNETIIPAVKDGECFSCDEAAKEGNPLEACSQCKRQNHVKGCMTDVADEEGDGEVLVCAGCKAKFFGAKDN